MKPSVDALGAIERVWRHDLLPLLEEHYFRRLTRAQVHDRFAWTRCARKPFHRRSPPNL